MFFYHSLGTLRGRLWSRRKGQPELLAMWRTRLTFLTPWWRHRGVSAWLLQALRFKYFWQKSEAPIVEWKLVRQSIRRHTMSWCELQVSNGQLNPINPSICRWKVSLDARMLAICGGTHEAKIAKTLWHSRRLKPLSIFLFMVVSYETFWANYHLTTSALYESIQPYYCLFIFSCNAELQDSRGHVTSSHPSDISAGGDWRRSHYGSCPSEAQWINVDRNGNSKDFSFLSEVLKKFNEAKKDSLYYVVCKIDNEGTLQE